MANESEEEQATISNFGLLLMQMAGRGLDRELTSELVEKVVGLTTKELIKHDVALLLLDVSQRETEGHSGIARRLLDALEAVVPLMPSADAAAWVLPSLRHLVAMSEGDLDSQLQAIRDMGPDSDEVKNLLAFLEALAVLRQRLIAELGEDRGWALTFMLTPVASTGRS